MLFREKYGAENSRKGNMPESAFGGGSSNEWERRSSVEGSRKKGKQEPTKNRSLETNKKKDTLSLPKKPHKRP